MKIVLLFSIIILYLIVHFTLPSFSGVVQCYDEYAHANDELSFKIRAQNLGKEPVCEIRYSNISSLASCITQSYAKTPQPIRSQLVGIYNAMLQTIRPNAQGVESRKVAHNEDCVDYPDFYFGDNR